MHLIAVRSNCLFKDPAAYPNLDIYPDVTACEVADEVVQAVSGIKVILLEAAYPNVEPCRWMKEISQGACPDKCIDPPVYPHLRIYPDVLESCDIGDEIIQVKYPNFDICASLFSFRILKLLTTCNRPGGVPVFRYLQVRNCFDTGGS